MPIRKVVVAAALFFVGFVNVAGADAQTVTVPPPREVKVQSPGPKAAAKAPETASSDADLPVTGGDVVPLVAFGAGALLVGLLLRARFRTAR